MGFEARGVPTTVIGEAYWIGYSGEIAQEIEAKVAACSASGCPDAGVGIVPEASAPEPTATPAPDPTPTQVPEDTTEQPGEPEETPAEADANGPKTVLTLPIIGTIDLRQQSLVGQHGAHLFCGRLQPLFAVGALHSHLR